MSSRTDMPTAARAGRRIGIAMFWCAAVWIVVASSRSVLMELYGSGDTNDASPEQVASCATELRSLEHSLLDHAAQDVRWPVRAKVTQQWIAQWDKRYAAVEHCGSLETARKRLRQMRERTVALIQAHTRKTVPLAESIDRMLDQISARTPS